MLKVDLKIVEGGIMPSKGSEEAACLDLVARKIELNEDGMVVCYLGITTRIPKGYHARLVSRSNVTKYGWTLANSVGIIDSDFRNEWQARFRPLINKGKEKTGDVLIIANFPYKEGERVAQFSIHKNIEFNFNLVEGDLEDSERGLGGFESTGR